MTTPATPQAPEELEDLFHDLPRLKASLEDATLPGLVKDYAEKWAATKYGEELNKQAGEQIQVGLQDFMRNQAEKNGARPVEGWRPGMAPLRGQAARRARAAARSRRKDAIELFDRQHLFSPTAVGAHESIDNDGYSNTLTQFVWATLKGEHVAAQGGDPAMLDELRTYKGRLAKALEIKNAGMSERIPSEGGFLIPENLRSEILALSLEDGVMRDLATVIPMDSLRVPLPSVDDTSHTSNVFGGVAASWTAEGAALNPTAPSFGRLVLIANKLTAYTLIPNELLQDAASPMDVWFNTFFPQAISFFEDLAFLTGDGIDQPEGVLNCPGAVKVTRTTSAEVLFADLAAMMARIWPPSLKRAIWVCSPDVLPFLFQLGMTVGGTAISPPSWLANMQALDAPGGSDGSGYNFRLFGRPVRVTEKVPAPAAGNTGSIALIDPSYYLLGDRQAMQVASSAEYQFANDMMAYRVIERVDGRGWFRTPLTPANNGATLSPFVLLTT